MLTLKGKQDSHTSSVNSELTILDETGGKKNIFIRKNLENEFHGIPAG